MKFVPCYDFQLTFSYVTQREIATIQLATVIMFGQIHETVSQVLRGSLEPAKTLRRARA